MERLSDRHEGTLEGKLAPLDQTAPAEVELTVDHRCAHLPAVQHTAWMLANLLARQVGVVAGIHLRCPPDVPLSGLVVPLAGRTLDLRGALATGVEAIGAVRLLPDGNESNAIPTMVFTIGPGEAEPDSARVFGLGWRGAISREGIEAHDPIASALPVGPYIAACLAAAEVFKSVRLGSILPANLSYSGWTFLPSVDTNLALDGPADLSHLTLEATLAGCGAVGSTWLHTVWATPEINGAALVADSDQRGVDITNLNRCPIFGQASLGRQKASEAARICSDAPIALIPHDGSVGEVLERPPLLICAVDRNASRQAVQSLYAPRLLAASTEGMRAEVLRCDPEAGAPCVRCFNPPEADLPDADARRDFLALPEHEKVEQAASVGLRLDDALAWAIEGTCSHATDKLFAKLRATGTPPRQWAVGFVSAMSGVMLASQTYKELLCQTPLGAAEPRALFQFFNPLATTNAPRPYLRDPACPMCAPGSPALDIWMQRYRDFAV